VTSALERSPPDALAMSDDLPPPNTQRWVVRRKAALITAVRSGRITLEEALGRYNLTEEEYRSWERAFDEHGLPGLRSTRLQQYHGPRPSRRPRSRRWNNVAEVDTDTELDPLFGRGIRIAFCHSPLDLNPAAQGIHHAGELRKEAIARVLYDPASVLPDPRIDQRPEMRLQACVDALFIRSH
jgi:hypothetical protein